MLRSYAQNFEDVIIWRALRNTVPQGFYIDIGANDPTWDSVSKSFYDAGWNGINVEPVVDFAKELSKERPRDLVLQVAVSSVTQELEFFEFSGTGLSTSFREIAEGHKARGFLAEKVKVHTQTLDSIFELGSTPEEIHWLKIDVEGAEADVLSSWDTSKKRPWILVIESTRPLTNTQTHLSWETSVLEKGYLFVYSDGINKFYLHEKHKDLEHFFESPPNAFDDFISLNKPTSNYFSSIQEKSHPIALRNEEALRASIAKINILEMQAKEHVLKNAKLEIEIDRSTAVVNAIRRSLSWRLTEPLRRILEAANKINNLKTVANTRLQKEFQQALLIAMAKIYSKPKLRNLLLGIVGALNLQGLVNKFGKYLLHGRVNKKMKPSPARTFEPTAREQHIHQILGMATNARK
jgi:FkbM family methyltransferase